MTKIVLGLCAALLLSGCETVSFGVGVMTFGTCFSLRACFAMPLLTCRIVARSIMTRTPFFTVLVGCLDCRNIPALSPE